jgi:hypothetical protein
MKEVILQSNNEGETNKDVMRLVDIDTDLVTGLLSNFGLSLRLITKGCDIPGSYWGDEEAGLIGNELLARMDTPLHSILHETCHYICMDKTRREGVHTNAGGDYDEENAVCYLQILLADQIENFGRKQMFEDMDRWGYTFRLGSAKSWFEQDAEDALEFLLKKNLINQQHQPTFELREF